jgi:isopropylmalate/homocitrate/citramalate synthase
VSAVEIYDATLRDGMQGRGMSLSALEKVRVVRKLDELGVDLVEAGFPASNPKELELFDLLAAESLEHAEIAAFGMTRRRAFWPSASRPSARSSARPGACTSTRWCASTASRTSR